MIIDSLWNAPHKLGLFFYAVIQIVFTNIHTKSYNGICNTLFSNKCVVDIRVY